MKKFNVLFWDFNTDSLTYYDVLPYFRDCYKERIERSKNRKLDDSEAWYKVPTTFDEFKKFVKDNSLYRFWSRCEYEMICHGWPVQKKEHKLDIHEQIMMNVDLIAEILYKELKENKV
jgi:hypothetical protein